MFVEIARNARYNNKAYLPFAPAPRRDSWENIDPSTRELLIREGEKYLHYNYPPLPITAFLDFKRTGNRVRFEDIYFSRRRALNALVMAECAEYQGRFMDDILNGIYALCEESGWQLPPHNSYERSKPQEPLPDVTDPVLDLFACETGAQLAMAMYLLSDSFERISPSIHKMINAHLTHRIIKPFFNRHFWWMGNGDEPMCNWTVWCIQNTLITLFLADGVTPEQKNEGIQKAAYGIDCFLKDYGEDGCCSEGAGYYHHAALCLFNAMEVLNAVTDNCFAPLYNNEKIRNIALYIYNVHVDDKYFINYADCSPIAGRAGVREYLFAKRIKSPEMMGFAAADYRAAEDKILTDEINLFYRVQNAFTAEEITAYGNDPSQVLSSPAAKHVYYESNGLFITGNPVYTLAVKGGNNADSHNHNDVGSITLYKNGLPYLIDVGVESYTARTFSSRRYEIWTMQSQYHNTPTFGSVMQKDGRQYQARVLAAEDTSITMDIAGAYPKEESVPEQYIRRAELTGKGVLVCDQYPALPDGSFMTLMTYDRPALLPSYTPDCAAVSVENMGTITAVCRDALGGIHIPSVAIEEIPVTDPRLSQAWKHSIYRIKIFLTGEELTLHIR